MKTKILIAIIFLALFAFAKDSLAYGNYQALEITNIKPAGTGSPAISQYNRIFRAYPGITYSVPVGVIGGAFPYVFSLSDDAPSGMTIDNHTGVITWTNPQTNATPTVTVHDKDGDSVTATWTITVTDSTNDFIFVNDDYNGTETGSITQPYNSIQDVLDLGSSAVNRIVYFREGTYAVPVYNSERYNYTGCSLSANGGRAHIWIGYPNENVAFNMYGINNSYATWFEAYSTAMDNIWFENILFQSPYRWGWIVINSQYFTFFDMNIDDLEFNEISGNPGGVCNYSGSSHYMYIVDSVFTDFVVAQHLGSFYYNVKLLIERNIFGERTGDGSCVHIKQNAEYTTIRHNNFQSPSSLALTGAFHNCNNNEILFNYFSGPVDGFNNDGDGGGPQGETWFYRNTVMGATSIEDTDYPDSCDGPWYFENNIFQNAAAGLTWGHWSQSNDASQCVDMTTNLTGTAGLVNASGLLINRSNVGTYGWEIAEDEYWDGENYTTLPASPSGLSIS